MNQVYNWPFDLSHGTHGGPTEMNVVDVHGRPHVEQCDPGIFPSFFYDHGREAGREAFLDVIRRNVVQP
eukprot:SAG22_NODE_1055_length_5789_cov_3.943234_7_plen_69_part_00